MSGSEDGGFSASTDLEDCDSHSELQYEKWTVDQIEGFLKGQGIDSEISAIFRGWLPGSYSFNIDS